MDFMTPEERVKALEALEEQQLRLQKRAALSVWISVGVAAVVLVALIGFAYSRLGALKREMAVLTDQMANLTDQKSRLLMDIKTLEIQKETAEKEKETAEKEKTAFAGVLSKVPEAQRKEAVDRQLAASPQSELLPRIYMQTLSHDDNVRAQAVRKALVEAGYLVLGIENVPKALPLKRSDVRFYHKVEQAQAEKIAEVMKLAGERNVEVKYLERYENSTKVRPNHFEVWLIHGGVAQTSQ